jgi:Type II secretion system (T2SS), protein E, N-terminal domain
VTFELGRGLLLSGKVSPERLSEALYVVVTQGIPLARALVGLGAIDEAELEHELAKEFPDPITRVVPSSDVMERIPPGLCHRLGIAPLSLDKDTGTVEAAVLDPRDSHAADELGFHLQCSVKARRASYAALREALEAYPAGLRALAPPMGGPPGQSTTRADRSHGHTPVWGTPASRVVAPAAPASGSTYAMAGGVEAARPDPFGEERFITRTWDSPDLSEPASIEEASWDAEPVFELRRLGPPPTVPDPEPVTIRLTTEEATSLARKRPSSPPKLPRTPSPSPVLSPPVTSPRVPTAPNAPSLPYADLGSTLASIRVATDRDSVLGLVLLGVRSVGRRVATLVVRKDCLAGWSCTPEFGDEGALKELKIPLRAPNLLTAVLSGGVHLGPLMGTVAAPLLRVMRSATQDVAIAAIRVGDRAAVLIVADELGDTLLATKRIDEIARVAGDALLRILRTKRE